MNLDNLNAQDGAAEGDGASTRNSPETRQRPLADREVPLGHRGSAEVINSWLDGELPEAAAHLSGMTREVELWKQIDSELDKRRHLRTPQHVQAQIMAALPMTRPQLISPWWRRELVVSPMRALAVAAALMLLAALATAILLRIS